MLDHHATERPVRYIFYSFVICSYHQAVWEVSVLIDFEQYGLGGLQAKIMACFVSLAYAKLRKLKLIFFYNH